MTFTKRFPSRTQCRRAGANHGWLTSLGPPLVLPRLVHQGALLATYEYIHGRHAEPADLEALAAHLGLVHATAYEAELHRARLDQTYVAPSGHRIPDFITSRMRVIRARFTTKTVPEPLFTHDVAIRHLCATAEAPAAFYKDTNPRNVLVTPSHPVLLDFDDLTLAPFGYDLAKLIVTLAMTHGAIPPPVIARALDAYNASVAELSPGLRRVTWEQLMIWSELHHILTSPYIGRGGYRHGWHEVRPAVAAGLGRVGRDGAVGNVVEPEIPPSSS